jgi:Na+/H+ antiporter NhaD/arsenite permease-like protein
MEHALGETLPLWSILPFADLPVTIALGPLTVPIWWAEHYDKVNLGAVFMGANSYIGNGPNFMVKAIAEEQAEEQSVRMPTFFGYMAYSGAVLVPIFLLVTLVFFR